jgi:hypothetical protein
MPWRAMHPFRLYGVLLGRKPRIYFGYVLRIAATATAWVAVGGHTFEVARLAVRRGGELGARKALPCGPP